MKNFSCSKCGHKVYFENVQCLNCKSALGFDTASLSIVALAPAITSGLYRKIGAAGSVAVRYCANSRQGCCNWVTPAQDTNGLCPACDLNRTIPNLAETGSVEAWQLLERAKKRLIYSLLRFGVPIDATANGLGKLTFDFVRDAMTGHLDGVITIDVMETDAVERERQRQLFGEPYRTILGHLRHESGHFYWKLLVEAHGPLDQFRTLFGDERNDYAAALQNHHAFGAPGNWQASYVSAYASTHPWEDWAETWAHYLHMVDAVDTAEAEGMEPRAAGLLFGSLWPFKTSDVYRELSFDNLMERWIPLATALNSLNRCMGHDDFYPFVLSSAAQAKLRFVHQVLRQHAGQAVEPPSSR
jgi:hypothetical protein